MRRLIALRALGVTVCLIGAFLMGWGEPILGENHTGIATVIGIIGIGIISNSPSLSLAQPKRKEAYVEDHS